ERAEELVLRLERGEDPQSLLTLAGDLCATLRSLGHELRALSGLAPLRDRTGSTPAAAPQIFTEVLALCRGRFQAADVELRVGEVPAEIWLKGRAGELVTALFGLLNAALAAVEFASPKGTGSRWVAVDVTPHDQTLRVRITWPGPLPKDEASLVAVDLAREALEAHGGRLNPEDSPQGQWVLDLSKAA
ncbi:MAG TPA: hypothetical protein VL588_04505, partial [Bdellovibrionota bacterium]|nr:hypothetical protein [Bdellovibrionota bacterium]